MADHRPKGEATEVQTEMPTTAGGPGRARYRGTPLAIAFLGAVLLGGCSVGVPDPSVPAATAGPPVLATPTITPGHDAAAVAARDLPFAAGDTLAPGVAVGISDELKGAPGWRLEKENVAGASQYAKADGCVAAARVSTGQGPLVRGGDRDSTVALFQYLDATIEPSYLKTETLRWGGTADAPGKNVEVLALQQTAPGGRSTAVLARLFGTAGSSTYISLSCPDAATLALARADVVRFLPLLPPAA
ncbi:hypothetical protein QF031_001277 [Pseudarthrobacter defluvii]|uniref:hypothetical protein n=1 Tax=Pseudarthrobacter defluvii TaxID=410837 RepID=UPI002786F249|nr:hypothetical protein [Pseudarthrobacter defluvii]MDQ0768528.1 hypothetical protein [Pseudarthrobacter defluvii]